jgi:hypothetical protein
MAEEPRFVHDCDNCHFLGHYKSKQTGEDFDLYYCANSGVYGTTLARFGNEGSEYASGICFYNQCDYHAEAVRRAYQRDILPVERLRLLVSERLKSHFLEVWRTRRLKGLMTEDEFLRKLDEMDERHKEMWDNALKQEHLPKRKR